MSDPLSNTHLLHENVLDVDDQYKRYIHNFLNNKQHLVFVISPRQNFTQYILDTLHEAMEDKNMTYSVVIFATNSSVQFEEDSRVLVLRVKELMFPYFEFKEWLNRYWLNYPLLKSDFAQQVLQQAETVWLRFDLPAFC